MTKNNVVQIGNPIKKGDQYIHPITLNLIKNTKSDNNVYPTEIFLQDREIFIDNLASKSKSKIEDLDTDELQKNFVLPKTVYNEDYLLYIYQIFNIDELNKFIDDEMSKDTNFKTINRVINIFVLFKYEEFKKNSNSLVEIFTKIYNKYWNKYNVTELDKKLVKYISYYLENNDKDNFDFDLGKNLKSKLRD